MERLQKVLAHCGVASRRASENLIVQGRVTVNGQIAHLGMKVDADRDTIRLDGEPICKERRVYLLLNKPVGYLSTVSDPHHRPTVLDLVGRRWGRIYPVGRLDMDSRGLLLMSNDGLLTHRLLHPRYGIPRKYQVQVAGAFTATDLLRKGLPLEEGWARVQEAHILSQSTGTTTLELTLTQGKKRQLRRMFQALSFKVLDLKRTALSFLTLQNVKEGEYRPLTLEEIQKIKGILSLE